MKRTDGLNIQSCCLFQKILYLCTVFAYDTDIIAACFACPVFFHIKSTKFAKTVCREKNFVTGVISNHNFRPVNHRSSNKCKSVLSEREGIPFFNNNASIRKICSEELFHHSESFCTGNDGGFCV